MLETFRLAAHLRLTFVLETFCLAAHLRLTFVLDTFYLATHLRLTFVLDAFMLRSELGECAGHESVRRTELFQARDGGLKVPL